MKLYKHSICILYEKFNRMMYHYQYKIILVLNNCIYVLLDFPPLPHASCMYKYISGALLTLTDFKCK